MKSVSILFMKFCGVGAVNTIVSLILYYILIAFNINYLIAIAIGYIVSSIIGYFLNKTWVFKQKQAKIQASIFKYYALYISALVLNLICMSCFVKIFNISEIVAPILTIIITTTYNFIISKIWVFNNSTPCITYDVLKKDKTLTFLLIAFLVLASAVLINNYFNHPVADDFSNINGLINLLPDELKDNPSTLDLISVIPKQALHIYLNWQGTYFANFLFFINPLLISFNAYKLTMALIQLFWLIGTYFFFSSLPAKDNKSKIRNIKLYLIFIIFSIMSMYSLGEGIYWFTGSILYIIPFTISLIFFGILFKHHYTNNTLLKILCFVIAIILGGTSYVTGLTVGFVLLLLSIREFIKKGDNRIFYISLLITFAIGFAFNVFSPGNFIRIDHYEKISIIHMLFLSFANTIGMIKYLLFETIFLPLVILALPIISAIASKTNFTFKHPILLSLLCFLCFFSTFMPMAYSYGSGYQETRVQNIQLFYLVIMATFCITYFIGCNKNKTFTRKLQSPKLTWISIIILPITISAINTNNITGFILLDDLLSGRSRNYNICMNEIESILKSDEQTVKLNNCPIYPTSFHYYYMVQGQWEINAMQEYYNKKILIES